LIKHLKMILSGDLKRGCIEKKQLSAAYGELRKLIIARAMVNSPDILVLDEPCSSLDRSSRKDFLFFLEKLASAGTHVILVTHHLDDIIPSITHIAVMDNGRIISQGKRDNFSSLFKKE